MNKFLKLLYSLLCFVCLLFQPCKVNAQIDTERVMTIGKNALYFEDYLLSIQYFNDVIRVKPYLAEPYFFRAVAKFYLEDYRGAEEDCSLALERNPFITDAYQVRGISRQTLKKDSLAIIDYNAGLKYLPENKVFLINKAVAQINVKDYDGSEKTFQSLIGYYPNYDNAYLGQASLRLERGDTIAALESISRCIELNANNGEAFIMRADIMIKNKSDYQSAVDDLGQAIKLEPKRADLFVNRAFLKYKLDDYFGAMADFDYAIDLDPYNVAAHQNRGLLRMEVEEDNKAIDDFSFVIDREPDNVMAIYNRATLYQKIRQYSKAIADYDKVIKKFPDMAALYYARSECKRLMGNTAGGEADYNKSKRLLADNKKRKTDELTPGQAETDPEEEVIKKFQNLVTIENDNSIKPEYENKYRGKVQNLNTSINFEGIYVLTYYDKTSELRVNAYYQKDVDDINSKNYLRDKLYITNVNVAMTETQIQKQFELIRHYSNLLTTAREKRPVDYFGRAVSYTLVKNYDAAIEDLGTVISLNPEFALAYFARATAYIEKGKVDESQKDKSNKSFGLDVEMINLKKALEDLDKVIELSPALVYAYFNKGDIYLKKGDYTAAISCYTAAIEKRPDFGEAYYNRGIAYFQLGNMESGVKDLSKAGELGIMSSYKVLKRMSKTK